MEHEIDLERVFNKEFRKRGINRGFKEAKKFVEKRLGIGLTLIEMVELRKIVEFTNNIYFNDMIKYVKGIGGDEHSIIPDIEAALIFMNKNYGTQIYNIINHSEFNLKRGEIKKLIKKDYYLEYFKRMQEEMHFP